jgi:hypothetical protein
LLVVNELEGDAGVRADGRQASETARKGQYGRGNHGRPIAASRNLKDFEQKRRQRRKTEDKTLVGRKIRAEIFW